MGDLYIHKAYYVDILEISDQLCDTWTIQHPCFFEF